MKIVFMGTPDFAAAVLEALAEAGETVALVVTQPDREKGRGKELAISDVKRSALAHGFPVFQPERIKRPEAVERLKEVSPDLIVVAAFGQILPKEILALPRYGCVNVHASLLPKYRGAAPIQQALIDGEEKTGITLMKMDEGLDTGDILLQQELSISPEETGGSLFDRLSALGAALMVKALPLIAEGKLSPRKQEEALASYAGMLKKDSGRLSFADLSAVEAERRIRAFNPWPSAFTEYNGKLLKLWKARVVRADGAAGEKSGTLTEVTEDELRIACREGILGVSEVQLAGKKRMSTREFLKGTRIHAGEQFQ